MPLDVFLSFFIMWGNVLLGQGYTYDMTTGGFNLPASAPDSPYKTQVFILAVQSPRRG